MVCIVDSKSLSFILPIRYSSYKSSYQVSTDRLTDLTRYNVQAADLTSQDSARTPNIALFLIQHVLSAP